MLSSRKKRRTKVQPWGKGGGGGPFTGKMGSPDYKPQGKRKVAVLGEKKGDLEEAPGTRSDGQQPAENSKTEGKVKFGGKLSNPRGKKKSVGVERNWSKGGGGMGGFVGEPERERLFGAGV